ncbi:MAG: hypothetical protein P8I03_11245 [Thalassotalea sp.]|nr:hypothetical protein [Thalassotalea sp.]
MTVLKFSDRARLTTHLLNVDRLSLFYFLAIGSRTNLGFYNVFNTSTLPETSANYFEQGTCP